MLRRVVGQVVWTLLVAAVLNGIAGLCMALLRFAGVIGGPWTTVLAPLWVPLAIATVLEIVLLQLIWASTTVPAGPENKPLGRGARG